MKWRKVGLEELHDGMRVTTCGAGRTSRSAVARNVSIDPKSMSGTAQLEIMKHGGKESTSVIHNIGWNGEHWTCAGTDGTLYHPPRLPDEAKIAPRIGRRKKRKNGLKRAYHWHTKEVLKKTEKSAEKGYITREAMLARRVKLQQEIEWIDNLLG